MIQEGFTFYRPHKALREYVRYYWVFSSNLAVSALTFPTGYPQIIFHKRKPLYILELNQSQSRLTISGQVNFPSHLSTCGDTEMIVVEFKPYGLSAFLNIPASLFYNREVSGYDTGDKGLRELDERISGCEDNSVCIKLIDNWLLSRIANLTDHRTQRIKAAVNQIFTVPQTSISDLAATACLGKKQFERSFRSLVGINPKEYAEIVRFQRALALMQCGESELGQIAYTCGYSDQSHFTREFRKFSGLTPSALLKTTSVHSDLFSNPV